MRSHKNTSINSYKLIIINILVDHRDPNYNIDKNLKKYYIHVIIFIIYIDMVYTLYR